MKHSTRKIRCTDAREGIPERALRWLTPAPGLLDPLRPVLPRWTTLAAAVAVAVLASVEVSPGGPAAGSRVFHTVPPMTLVFATVFALFFAILAENTFWSPRTVRRFLGHLLVGTGLLGITVAGLLHVAILGLILMPGSGVPFRGPEALLGTQTGLGLFLAFRIGRGFLGLAGSSGSEDTAGPEPEPTPGT